jgi:hypothetical protein
MRETADMGSPAVALAKTAKKINLSLSEKSFGELQEIVNESGRTMSDIIRFALSLAKLYFDETKKGNAVFIGDQNGKAMTRIVFP